MKTNFYLKDGKTSTETRILLFVSWNNLRIKVATKYSISPTLWNKKKQLPSNYLTDKNSEKIKIDLEKISKSVHNYFKEFEAENKGEQPNILQCKQAVENIIEPKEQKQKNYTNNFLEFIESFIHDSKVKPNTTTKKIISSNTLRNYKQTQTKLLEYMKKKNIRILTFDSITLNFYYDFVEYLRNDLMLANNTLGSLIKNIKVFMNEAYEMGLHNNLEFKKKRFVVPSESTDTVYLDEEELQTLFELDLSQNPRLEKVRDLFLIGCHTGLRFSDFTRLRPENIDNDFIEIETQKTGKSVVIPIHDVVKEILLKYKNNLPKAISNQKMNSYLKEIAKLSDFNESTTKSYTKGGQKISRTFSKFDLVTTHTARRSFATNTYKMGVPAITIMQITGHLTEKAFLRYIRLTPREHAEKLREAWNNRNTKLKIA